MNRIGRGNQHNQVQMTQIPKPPNQTATPVVGIQPVGSFVKNKNRMLRNNAGHNLSKRNRNIRVNIVPVQQLQLPCKPDGKKGLPTTERTGQPNRPIEENLVKERARAQQRKPQVLQALKPCPKRAEESPPAGGRSRRRDGDSLGTLYNQSTNAFASHMKKAIINIVKKWTPKGTGM
jgi:hypothetical protein